MTKLEISLLEWSCQKSERDTIMYLAAIFQLNFWAVLFMLSCQLHSYIKVE